MRNFKCGRCEEVNELGTWNRNSKVFEMKFPFTLHEMYDDVSLYGIRGNITFKCPSCNRRMTVEEIEEII